jgi:RHS repeat-associated protein
LKNHIIFIGYQSGSAIFIGRHTCVRYRGYYYDTESGLYYLQSRYYDPETGRFISKDDPILHEDETGVAANLYAYCDNNPINEIDPLGLASYKIRWWGYEFLFSNSEATKMINIIRSVRNWAGLIAGLNSVVPEPFLSKSVALALWTFGATLWVISDWMYYANGKKGIKVKFVWPFIFIGAYRR